MMTLDEVTVVVGRISRPELERWLRQGWLRPAVEAPEPRFSEIDVARARLIAELQHDLAVETDAMPLVLSLLDQLYSQHRRLRALAAAVRDQPPEIREAIMARLPGRRGAG